MHPSALSGLCLVFLPLSAAAAALHAPPHGGLAARDARADDLHNVLRAITLPNPEETTTHTTQAATSQPPTTSTNPTSTSTTSSTSTTPTTSSTPSTTTTSTSTTAPVTSRATSTNADGSIVVITQFATASSSATPSATGTPEDDSSGPGKGTYIGLGVAGGIALLALAGFIIWKFTQKRFSSFDDDEGADINWPMPKEELAAPKAPAMSSAAANATSSSVDLTASSDPYAVPPLPPKQNAYYDDPSGTAAASYYDPYRGPVPHTFHSPPGSVDSHAQQYAEAIPMSTYPSASGRQSPGPNAAYDQQLQYQQDPYGRTRSPGPNMAYDQQLQQDPYAAGRRSPGPSLAYGMDPAMRTGTPVSMMGGMPPPPRMGTPLAGPPGVYPPPHPSNIPPGLDVPRAGTPQSYGRASPGIPAAYAAQQPLVNPYGRSTPNPYGP